jgi:hypothetical protein
MAAVTVTAPVMAASSALNPTSGYDKRMSNSSFLTTPGSGTFPSELLSPMAASPGFMRREDALKTPITPPSAYLDFLKNMSPAVMSPAQSATSARFSFNEKNYANALERGLEALNPKSCTFPSSKSGFPSLKPTSQPSLSREISADSTGSAASDKSGSTVTTTFSMPLIRKNSLNNRPESPRLIIPPSPFVRPNAPRSASGNSAVTPRSYTGTPLSAQPWSASTSFSPRERQDAALSGTPGRVSVRHVITRTVTYCRTPTTTMPLEPAPRGKRRRLERGPGSISSGSASIKESAEEDTEDSKSAGTFTLSHRKRSPSQLQQQTFGPPLPIKQEPKEDREEKMEIEAELNEESLSSSSSVISSLSRSSAEPEANQANDDDAMESETKVPAVAEPASAPPTFVVHDTVESAAAAALAAITNTSHHFTPQPHVQEQASHPQSTGEDRPMEEAN